MLATLHNVDDKGGVGALLHRLSEVDPLRKGRYSDLQAIHNR